MVVFVKDFAQRRLRNESFPFGVEFACICAALSSLRAFPLAGLPVHASRSNRKAHLSDLQVTRSGTLLFAARVPYIPSICDNRRSDISCLAHFSEHFPWNCYPTILNTP